MHGFVDVATGHPPSPSAQTSHTHQRPCILPNLLVAPTATQAEQAPINKQTAMAFGPSGLLFSRTDASLNSGLFPGSNTEKTTQLIPVPTNCGNVVYRFMMPKYFPELSPEADATADSSDP